jgi:uncharacterized protein (DUF1499 family)
MVWKLLSAAVVIVALAVLYLTRNVVRTGPDARLPELAALYLRGNAHALLEELAATCRDLGWREVRVDRDAMTVRAEVVSALFGFVDDVEIRLLDADAVALEARVRSASRVGRGDLGANARHVMDLRAAVRARGILLDPRP